MSGNYVLIFSNPLKTDTVTVPSAATGSGKNDYDTSLELAGPGYVNYGISYAQNFLKLLENFSSPYPPNNAIEGQLWYDTSDSNRKVLRVNNGTQNASRWAPASGIFQQPNDPAVQYEGSVYDGDLWADTNNAQLKIRYGNTWRIVGPDLSSGIDKTGTEFTYLESTTGSFFPVILNWANNKVISIVSNNEFIPKIVIEGFTNVKIGYNLTSKNQAKYYGTAEKAESLVVGSNSVIRAGDILKNRTIASQVHTGTLKVDSSEGLSVINSQYNHEIKIKSNASDGASINFNSPDLTKKLKVGIGDFAFVTFNPVTGSVGVNTATSTGSPAFEVFGNSYIRGKLTINEGITPALEVQGRSNFTHDAIFSGNQLVVGITTVSNKLVVGATTATTGKVIIDPAKDGFFDLGTTSTRFRWIYAQNVGRNVNNTGTATTVFYGRLEGTATKLATKREIRLKGQITGTVVMFDGSANVEFTTTMTTLAFTQSISTSSATAFHSILVVNTSTTTSQVEVISKKNFLNDVSPSLVLPGTILPFFGNTSTVETLLKPDGRPAWLLCINEGTPGLGKQHTGTNYFDDLYLAIGNKFGGSAPNFRVPDMTASTTGTSLFIGAFPYYIMKT
jgi:hypothetical protein